MIKKIRLAVFIAAIMLVGSNSLAQNNNAAKQSNLLGVPKSQLPQVIAFMDALDNLERNRMFVPDRSERTMEEKIRFSTSLKLNRIKMMSAPPRCKNIKEIAVKLLEKKLELMELSKKQEKDPTHQDVPFANSDVYNDARNLAEEYKAERNEILLEIYDGNKTDYDENSFLGSWYSTRAQKIISIIRGGKWKMVTQTGGWSLEDGSFVWTYSDLGPRVKDKNRILHVGKRKFVLKEPDGSVTVFFKIN